MSRSLIARLERMGELLAPERIAILERRALQVEIEGRLASRTADRSDFVILISPTIDQDRQELLEEASKHHRRRLAGMLVPDEWRVPILAGQVIDYGPGTDLGAEAYATLEEYASSPDDIVFDEFAGRPNLLDSVWFRANRVLAVLGEDHGGSLHEAALPGFAELDNGWADYLAELAKKIANATAHRLEFMEWARQHEDEDRRALCAAAKSRRAAREAGHPVEVDDIFGLAAEMVSYPPDEDPPRWLSDTLRAARGCRPSPATPAHEEWVEANLMHWTLGADYGKRLRAEMAMVGVEPTEP